MQQTAEKRTWPGQPGSTKFDISADAARSLSMRVLEGVKALPRRGLEVGGLLVGTAAKGHIDAESLVAIPSEYPDGPVYRVPADILRAAIDAVEGEIVGIYRSRTDGMLVLDGQDEALLRMISDGRELAVLVVQQRKDLPAQVRFGVWRGEDVIWGEHVLKLSDWVRGVVTHTDPPRLAESPTPATEARPAETRALTVVVPSVPARLESKPAATTFATAALAVALVFAGAASVWFLQPQQPVAASRSRAVFGPLPEVVAEPNPQSATRSRTALEPVRERARQSEPVPSTQPVAAANDRTARRAFRPPPSSPQVSAGGPQLLADAPRVSVGMPAMAVHRTAPLPLASPLPAAPPVQFQPPTLVRQPTPVVIPPDLRRLLRNEVVLQFRANVDRSGRVSGVAPVNAVPGSGHEALVRIYTSAIRDWIFEPANRNGEAVAGDVLLSFRVSPGRL